MKKLLLILIIPLFNALVAAAQGPCDRITYNKDDIREFKSYCTPIDLDSESDFFIQKLIEPGKPAMYFIHIRVNEPVGKTINGVYIVLANGKKIIRPNEEIELEIDKEEESITHPGFQQSATIQLTKSEIGLLISAPITKYAISYLNEELSNSKDLFSMVQCLMDKN